MSKSHRKRTVSVGEITFVNSLSKLTGFRNTNVSPNYEHSPKFHRESISFAGATQNTLYDLVYEAEIASTASRAWDEATSLSQAKFFCNKSNLNSPTSSIHDIPTVVDNLAFEKRGRSKSTIYTPMSVSCYPIQSTTLTNSTKPSWNLETNLQSERKNPSEQLDDNHTNKNLHQSLSTTILMRYLANTSVVHPYSGLTEELFVKNPNSELLALEKRDILNILSMNEQLSLSGQTLLEFPYVASLMMPVQSLARANQSVMLAANPKLPQLRLNQGGYHSDIGYERPRLREHKTNPLHASNEAINRNAPGVYQLEKIDSETQVEQLRQMLKKLDKKRLPGSLEPSGCVSGATTPFHNKENYCFRNIGTETNSMYNLSHVYDGLVESNSSCSLLTKHHLLSTKDGHHPVNSTDSKKRQFLSPPSQNSSNLSECSKSLSKTNANDPQNYYLVDKNSVARRIRGQEINLLSPISF